MRTGRLTQTFVRGLQVPQASRRLIVWDEGKHSVAGFGVKVELSGLKTFFIDYRFPSGRGGTQRRYKIGDFGFITADNARKEAQRLRGLVRDGTDPQAVRNENRHQETAKAATERAARRTKRAIRRAAELNASDPSSDNNAGFYRAWADAADGSTARICFDFISGYSLGKNRTWRETDRIFHRYVVPVWGELRFADIKRATIASLISKIKSKNGVGMAQGVYAQLRKLANWYAVQNEDYVTPIVRGMAPTTAKEQQRQRVLSDDEMRLMWQALDASSPPFRQLCRALLLSAQRVGEVAKIHSREEMANGVWVIPASRYKTKRPQAVPLSDFAREVLATLLQPNGYYFSTTNGAKPFSCFGKAKAKLDVEMLRLMRERRKPGEPEPELEHWVLHDLRRTAKTLMSRAGVRPDISERVLGHKQAGVAATYDCYEYVDEKRVALRTLADTVRTILASSSADASPHLACAA